MEWFRNKGAVQKSKAQLRRLSDERSTNQRAGRQCSARTRPPSEIRERQKSGRRHARVSDAP
eukprot:8781153-Alexandrium_andersonii.AAC.1